MGWKRTCRIRNKGYVGTEVLKSGTVLKRMEEETTEDVENVMAEVDTTSKVAPLMVQQRKGTHKRECESEDMTEPSCQSPV